MEIIRNFKNLSKNDSSIAGGKGASLGEMTNAGMPVPPGFVVLSGAFEKFLKETDLNVEIDSILHKVNHKKIHTVEDASEKIQSLILEAKMPRDIKREILGSFKKLGSKYVAVRSSATAEDSSSAAWAGQLESYLNTTDKTLLQNVQKCWASLFTPRAIFYRFEKNLHKQKISMAVVVQKMVESEVSGIAFSVHPITQDRNQLIIEAGFGLGEAIVSGSITPDSYVVEKKEERILDKNIANQEKGIYRSKKHGNEWLEIPKSRQDKQKLSDSEIIKLSKLIIKIEDHYGFPCDIEWAREKGKFYITQSRPITTLLVAKPQDNKNLLNYIKTQNWFFGIKANESLLFYSARQDGCNRHLKKIQGVTFAENIFISINKGYPARILNLDQAKIFHSFSSKKILYNSNILSYYIKRNNLQWEIIEGLGEKLIQHIKKNDYFKIVQLYKEIIRSYEIISAQSITIFSLGLKLTEIAKNQKDKSILAEHNKWRNGVVFKEENMGKNLFYFFKFLTKRKNIRVNPLLLMKLLTSKEIFLWLDKKIPEEKILKMVELRKGYGFVYLSLRNFNIETIDDHKEAKVIRNYFSKLKFENTMRGNNKIRGDVTYKTNEKIEGQIIVIENKNELKNKKSLIKNRILVAIQTTPHYIPYIKKVIAIITDEGGITSHAAIISRELKIPCIVGTKIATRVLKDGDLVEVNANKGIVKILKKK